VRGALDADELDVLQPLPPGQQVAPAVAHPDDAGDGPEGPVGVGLEVPQQGADQIGVRVRVGVHGDHDVPRGRPQAGVEGGGLAAVGLPDDADPRVEGGGEALDDPGGAVRRAVVDDEELPDRIAARDQ
jgi:hypothetical protein